MRGVLIFVLACVLVISFSEGVFAVPDITFAPVTISDGQSVTLDGNGFGVKSTATPYLWDDFESGIIGQMPSGQITNIANYGTVQSNVYLGNKSLQFDYYVEYPTQGYWRRNAIDLGEDGSDKVYVSAWMYLDKRGSNCTSWQWKNFYLTSNSNLYISLTSSESVALTSSWHYDNNRWGNTCAMCVYFWDFSINNWNLSVNRPNPSDMWLWNEWQRVEFYYQRSSPGKTPDGILSGIRIGRPSPLFNVTNAVTNDDGDDPWRYVDLTNAVESVYDGYVNFTIYMDNLYIDKSQARIELCDSLTWSARMHCEIQPPTLWADGSITINVNQGSFIDGEDVYLFVVDENGDVSEGWGPITLGAGLSNCGDADADEGGSVSITELINYISQWKAGSVNIGDLITAIGEWKNGC